MTKCIYGPNCATCALSGAQRDQLYAAQRAAGLPRRHVWRWRLSDWRAAHEAEVIQLVLVALAVGLGLFVGFALAGR